MKIAWDRTNIGENYPGITLPLTYSFIRFAYGHVYESFLRLLNVRTSTINERRSVLQNMLGYIEGRVFYRIDNWYVFLTFLPGYRFNREFFETMLDPAQKKKDRVRNPVLLSRIESVRIMVVFTILFFLPSRLHRIFEDGFRKLYEKFRRAKIGTLQDEPLMELFEQTCASFFSLWAYTIVNDFRVMIYFGMLTKYLARIEGGYDSLKYLADIKNSPGSMRPIRMIAWIALKIARVEACRRLFEQDAQEIWDELEHGAYPKLKSLIDRYLERYGDRSANELKLEEPKFREAPVLFISLLKQYVMLGQINLEERLRNNSAIKHPAPGFNMSFAQRYIYSVLRDQTVQAMYRREQYRMRRGQAFGLARRVFLELGRRLVLARKLEAREDVFYLYQSELLDYCRFHQLPDDLRSIVVRRKQYLQEAKHHEVDRRVTTEGFLSEGADGAYWTHGSDGDDLGNLKGLGTSAGVVRGEVVVVESLDFTADYRGKILVTPATDPGWTVLFPVLKGVVTEQGGMLSHASIIAREVGIPCVVQAEGATKRLRSGQEVEINGGTGKIFVY